MIKAKMIPLKSVLKDVYLLMRESDVTEDLVMEFAIRGMEHLAVYHTYEKAVCVVRVDNCQASYPKGTYGIEGVLYMLDQVTPADIEIITTSTTNITADDNGYLIDDTTIDCKVANYRQVLFTKPHGWKYLPLSNFTFDRSVLCDSVNVQPQNCTIEGQSVMDLSISGCSDYFIPDNANSRFITSFDAGWLLVAYYRFPQNSNGDFVIPDHPLYNEALESYVLSKIYQRKWHLSDQGAQGKYTHYLQKWQELAAAATGELMMLSLPDYINLDKQNKFFRDDSPLKIFGGYGKERMELNNNRDSNLGYRRSL